MTTLTKERIAAWRHDGPEEFYPKDWDELCRLALIGLLVEEAPERLIADADGRCGYVLHFFNDEDRGKTVRLVVEEP